jgi:thymidylate synthase (FAD)
MIPVLDHGYVRLVETWGSDQAIIEAARMSTDKGFLGWGPRRCQDCTDGTMTLKRAAGWLGDGHGEAGESTVQCLTCKGTALVPGDEKLLAHLYRHKHSTPFEFAGMVIEVQAPLMVFREWQRHRTQSYTELSARYTPMPDLNYVPTVDRIMIPGGSNKQAQGTGEELTRESAEEFISELEEAYRTAQFSYAYGLSKGVPKELARLCVPVGRYSRMRAAANLRNWMGFLVLRTAKDAQWEIRQYANVVRDIISEQFPRTYALYANG